MSMDAQFNEQRSLLFGLAYRMLGSVVDAEDLVQETFLRWEKADRDAVRSPKAYLTSIVTRLAIDQLKSARVRRETYVGQWLPEPLVEDRASPADAVELAESLSTAFLVMLERLSPPERAAYLLREAFDYTYAEIADVLQKTEENCRQLAKRARGHMAMKRRRFESPGPEHERLANQFLEATRAGDMSKLVETLSTEAALYSDHGGKVPAARRTIVGADKIARLVLGLRKRFWGDDYSMEIRLVNGQPGLVMYASGQPFTVTSFAFSDGRIAALYSTNNPEKLTLVSAARERD